MGIDERMQREPNLKRIRDEIVPYLARSKDRLFGALIILVNNGDIDFEPFSSLVGKIPSAYKKVAAKIGFVTIDGGELIVLDGQHRLLALRQIIQGEAEGACVSEVPNDDISIIFIKFESKEKTRRIFNKVNRYAKPTSRGDNIITSEDDGYAILTRHLLEDEAPLGRRGGKEVVDWRHNTLAERSTQLTTISAVYETVKDILAQTGVKNADEKHQVNRPTEEHLDDWYETVQQRWGDVLQLDPFQAALADLSAIPEMRKSGQPYSMLFKPIGQIAMFKGLMRALDRKVAWETALKRLMKIDWNIGSTTWRDVIVTPDGRMIGRKEAYELAANLIAYQLAPDKFKPAERESLHQSYNRARGHKGTKKLEELPIPKA
jgi:DNA sulfur modification protein DndB